MRYLHFADTAAKEGYPNMARLWRAIAHAEYVHAGDHYRELKHLDGGFTANSMAAFGPGDTIKNLKHSIAGETFEIEEMYPVYIETAKLQNDIGAKKSFEWAFATEKLHKQMFEQALSVVEHGSDVALGPVQVCEVCLRNLPHMFFQFPGQVLQDLQRFPHLFGIGQNMRGIGLYF
ncbi:MAG: rubrerythrin family protein [Spirochaetia bacterium]